VSDELELACKVAVVTGASRGLGREIALGLARRGARVALAARSMDDLQAVENAIVSVGGTAVAAATDVTRPESVRALAETVELRLGPPSILVNAAGIFGPIGLIKDTDPERWVETLLVNAVGPYLTCRALVGGMIEGGWGRIVNVSSAGSLYPPGPLDSAYVTSKVTLNQLTRHLAAELEGTGVTANVIHPGDVTTDMYRYIRDTVEAMGPEADEYREWSRVVARTGGDPPEKAVALVLGLLSDAAASVNGRFVFIEDPLQGTLPSW
jgi:NAD(P)-dependent dehydrogenase (short-subunit alcohol dehydrogenase family)